ncbi:alginate export family protein [Aestuariibacter sp. A3R04]|uniref:alginate export family protein n=1 Tax=Aestuariibacter sp. A3R04 TaxID=2841571 RepID=UPI00208FFDA5|nr:alginate export family protein [Aestuariibacter sp. A3R04]
MGISKIVALPVVGGLAMAPGASLQAEELELDYSGSVRARYETLNNPIFPTTEEARPKTNNRLSTRIRLKGEANYGSWNATVEIEDSRAFLDDNDPTLKSSQVNALEPIQFFISYKGISKHVERITAGRLTLDHGSRRLMARTRYRNATNTFEGALVDTNWYDWSVRGFYLQPVSRFPADAASIDSNERAFDKSYSNRKFFGVYAESDDKAWKIHSYWLKEDDSPELATKNRDLYTLSVDYSKSFAAGWKGNIEAIGQTGTARQSSSASDTTDRDVRAWMVHAHIGKQISDTTFVRAEIDAASGDDDATDDKINAFDSLYGLRRFDYGPTDVYQTFPRSNILAPGLRSVTKLGSLHNIMVGYKGLWLQNVAAGEDDFLGHQLEVRWRYQAMKPLRLEFGGAYLAKGDALESGAYPDDAMYAYTGFMYSF